MQKSENLFVTFSIVELGSGTNPPGGRWKAGRWESETHRAFNGTGFQEGDPQLANGTRFLGMGPANQQLGPAIDYSNQLDLALGLPQLNVSPAISAIIPRPLRRGNSQRFQFQLAQFTMTGGNSGNGTRSISNWDPLLSGQLIRVNCNGTIECGAIQMQFGNANSGNCSSDLRAVSPCYTN
jgi:hypothetical protein